MLAFFQGFFSNKMITAALWGFFIAQVLKVILVLLTKKRLDFSRLVGSGGMPSSHAAFLSALTASVCRSYGVMSGEFAISFVVMCVVMYDASGVRRAVGQQAQILNKIVEHWDESEYTQKKLKELLGHTPVEVLAGAILGILIGVIV